MEILRDLSVSKREKTEITLSDLRVDLREKERERETTLRYLMASLEIVKKRDGDTQGSECLKE